jgi:glucosamine 6-phosphate synthetase-like amidotransferase/phosphosugar isomerase protein
MCGIGAFHSVGDELDAGRCARVLLRLLEVRGRDASGVAWHEDSSEGVETMILKGDISGSKLAEQIKPGDIGSTGIVHTRWATKGSPEVNANNHPIDVAGIVGVHNGHVSNDDALFKQIDKSVYSRVGEVDSEAAFAWLAHGDQEIPLLERMAMVKGNAALMWLNTNDKRKRLHLARLTSSPLVMGQMKGGSVVACSTEAILMEAAKRLNIQFEFVYSFVEGEYAIIEDGRLSEFVEVPMPKVESKLFADVKALPSYKGYSSYESKSKWGK